MGHPLLYKRGGNQVTDLQPITPQLSSVLQKPTQLLDMFSRLFTLLPLAALVAVAAAAPNAVEARDSECDVSDQSCCNTDQWVVRYLLPLLSP